MSNEEIKYEINKVLDHLSNKTLSDLLSLLRGIEGSHAISSTDGLMLKKILEEDRELLEKLAQ